MKTGNKQAVVSALRNGHFSPLAERIRFLIDLGRHWKCRFGSQRSDPDYAYPPS